jgi:DNA-binding transcriptional LysR family regulator
MLNFRQVQTFRTVMLAGSMTQAARDLHTTQPNVSRVIAQLETRIGLKLFERVGGKLVPTREGELFFRDVEQAFNGLRGLEQAAASLARRGAGHLRLSAVPSLALELVPEAMRAFSVRFPDVSISMQVADSTSVCQSVASGLCELGIASDVISNPGISYKLAKESRAVCILPSHHRQAQGAKPLTVADLAGEAFLSLSPQDSMRKKIDAVFAAENGGDRRKLVYESHFAAAICHMVAAGMGVSIANPLVTASFGYLGLQERAFTPEIVFPTYVVHPVGAPPGLLAKAFTDVVMKVAKARR